ncbi:MAG: regulator [Prolixibacteraceae bacterium]|jgi:DNA-binding CsgD family transcriptional regulator/archaellum component FlaG (FlaF/FlaG flagellin family)
MNRNYKPTIRNIFLFFLLLICNSSLFAFNDVYIKNYTKQEYQAASQNWSVAQDAKGYLYFANNIGLLEFDGISWTLYPAPEGAIIRAVAVDKNNRVYSAGYRELGFWERNALGRLEYHSLKKEVESNFTSNEEFWNVIASGQEVYFQSFSKVYIYANQEFKIVKPDGFVNSISEVGGQIFVNIMNKGIYEIINGQLNPFLVTGFFNNKEIRFILSLPDSRLLIGTANNGIMVYDRKTLSVWNPEFQEYFIRNVINHGCLSSDGKIIIGTILDGISVFDETGRLLYNFDKETGLQNNTVLGVISDNNQNIWVSLDKGIDFISFKPDPSFTIYERKELGAVYTAAIYRNKIYLGTNQGLYYRSFPSTDEAFKLVPETQGQIWDCKVIDDRLFVNHNKGTFEIHDDQVKQISTISGGFSIIENPMKPSSLVQSTYSNLIFYKKENNDWKIDKVVYQFNNLIRYVEADHFGNYWASHMYRGIFRLKLDNNDSLIYNHYYGKDVFGQDNNIHVFKVENRIVYTTGKQLYTFDDLNDTIIPYEYLNEKLGSFCKATRIVAGSDQQYWFITDQSYGLFSFRNQEIKKIKEYPSGLFNNQLIIGFENIVPIRHQKAILCLEDGYAVLNADTLSPASLISEQKPELRRISISGNNGEVSDLPLGDHEVSLRFNRNDLHLRFSFPFFGGNIIKYQSFIEGLDQQWSEPLDKPIFSFKRIPVGQYKIRVKAVNTWGESSHEFDMNLIILPPWYLSFRAYVVYFLLALVGLFIFRIRIIARIRKKESREREEKERELIQLRNEKLQAELSFKSTELANSTMAIIKKNEFLMNVKEMLNNQKIQLGSRYPDKYYDTLVKKIDDNIASQDEWKVFEANFERAHEQFMKTLKDNYTDLTPSDLRLCAFLRMNLASKEIAPLMGISVRGVENHRYRLRKKLDLDADGNLTDFIIRL